MKTVATVRQLPHESPAVSDALDYVASQLGIQKQWLINQIYLESGFNPLIKNPVSSARGLVQFMDATAKGMGYSGGSAEIIQKFPDIVSQLKTPVLNYYRKMMPFEDEIAFYGSTFYPAWRHEGSRDKVFSALIQAKNGGIKSVRQYADFVKAHAQKKMDAIKKKNSPNPIIIPKKTASMIPFAFITAIGVYFWSKKKK